MDKNLLALGNIDKSRNITQFGDEIVYGGGTYSAITARKLGYNSAILTKGNEALDAWIRQLEAMGIQVLLEKVLYPFSLLAICSSSPPKIKKGCQGI